MTGMLTLEHASVTLGRTPILKDVSLAVQPADNLAILGPNGAGKSTLLRAMAGVAPTCSGMVRLNQRPIADYTACELARLRAYLPQSQTVPGNWRVGDFIALGRYAHRQTWLDPQQAHHARAVREAACATDTTPWLDVELDKLSGGQRQRVYLAQVLAQQAPLLLLDEPTTFLDWQGQISFLNNLKKVRAQRQLALVCVLHDLNLAAQYFDRLVVLTRDGLAADGTPQEVLTPGLIKEVFGVEVHRYEHPETGLPVLVPLQPGLPGDLRPLSVGEGPDKQPQT